MGGPQRKHSHMHSAGDGACAGYGERWAPIQELAGPEPHSACSELADDSQWGEAAAFSQYVFTEEVRRQER